MKLTISSETQHADLIVDLLPDGFVKVRMEDHYKLVGAAGGASFFLNADQVQTLVVLLSHHLETESPGLDEEEE